MKVGFLQTSGNGMTLAVVAATALGIEACGSQGGGPEADASIPETGVIDTTDGGCRELVLVAQRSYKPSHSIDAETTLTSPLRFTIPSEADVLVGNAGNQLARLEFTSGQHDIACLYKGGASKAHPTSPADIVKGKRYLFLTCTDGSAPGDVATSSHVTFHIANGDDKDPANVTIAAITLNEAAPCGGIKEAGADAEGDSAAEAAADAIADASDSPAPSDAADAVALDAEQEGGALDSNSEGDAPDAGSDADAAVSTVCGDGIRNPATEECDLGPGPTRALCSPDCRVNDLLGILDPTDAGTTPARTLGEGRHPIATTALGAFGVVSIEPDANPLRLVLTTFSNKGIPSDQAVPFTGGSTPVLMSNPVVAAIPNDRYVVAYTDFNGDGDELGIALRVVDPTSAPSGAPSHANTTTSFSQYDPDLIATPSGLIVAWLDDSNVATGPDIMFRTFGNDLTPTSAEQVLANTSANEGDVALAPFGTSWAAAWRAGDSGLESLRVHGGGADWTIGPYLPGPVGDRPALAELDATHLIVVYSEGVDSQDSGVANESLLRGAVLSVSVPGSVTPFDIPAIAGGTDGLTQGQPNVVRVGSQVYVAWRSEGALGSAAGEELWLKLVGWNADNAMLDLSSVELPLPRWPTHRVGDQRRPALAALGLSSGFALVTAFDDLGKVFTSEGNGGFAVEEIPLPLLRVAGDGGP
jgi:hypothetical protein